LFLFILGEACKFIVKSLTLLLRCGDLNLAFLDSFFKFLFACGFVNVSLSVILAANCGALDHIFCDIGQQVLTRVNFILKRMHCEALKLHLLPCLLTFLLLFLSLGLSLLVFFVAFLTLSEHPISLILLLLPLNVIKSIAFFTFQDLDLLLVEPVDVPQKQLLLLVVDHLGVEIFLEDVLVTLHDTDLAVLVVDL